MQTKMELSDEGKAHRYMRWLILGLLIVVGLQLAACSPQAAPSAKEKPARVEPIGDTGLSRVVLTDHAAQRIGIKTMAVKGMQEVLIPQTGGNTELASQNSGETEAKAVSVQVVPYAAIIYDTKGKTWVYTNPEPLSFVRKEVHVDRILGDQALLTDQLPTGTQVVTIGVIELYGAETGVGK